MADMARQGIARGLDEICFTDHVDTIEWGTTHLRSDCYDWEKARQQYQDAVGQYGDRIRLKLGAELGEVYLGFDCAQRQMADAPPLDFVIGSVHMTRDDNGWFDLFYIDGDRDDAYYHAVIDAYVDAELSNFDITPDLSMKVEPTVINNQISNPSNRSVGLQCSFRF